MPPKRKSLKRKSTTATTAVPAKPASPVPPAKRQKVRATVERSTTSRSTRASARAESAVKESNDVTPPPNSDGDPSSPLTSQVSTVSSLSPVPEIHRALADADESVGDDAARREAVGKAGEDDQGGEPRQIGTRDGAPAPHQTPLDPQNDPQIPLDQDPADPPEPAPSRPLAEASQTAADEATPVKRVSRRRPPIFSEAMKREMERREAERSTANTMDGEPVSAQALAKADPPSTIAPPNPSTNTHADNYRDWSTRLHERRRNESLHGPAAQFTPRKRPAGVPDLRQEFLDLRRALVTSQDAVRRTIPGAEGYLEGQRVPGNERELERLFEDVGPRGAVRIIGGGMLGRSAEGVETGASSTGEKASAPRKTAPKAKTQKNGRTSLVQPSTGSSKDVSPALNAPLERAAVTDSTNSSTRSMSGSNGQPSGVGNDSSSVSHPSDNIPSASVPFNSTTPQSAPAPIVPQTGGLSVAGRTESPAQRASVSGWDPSVGGSKSAVPAGASGQSSSIAATATIGPVTTSTIAPATSILDSMAVPQSGRMNAQSAPITAAGPAPSGALLRAAQSAAPETQATTEPADKPMSPQASEKTNVRPPTVASVSATSQGSAISQKAAVPSSASHPAPGIALAPEAAKKRTKEERAKRREEIKEQITLLEEEMRALNAEEQQASQSEEQRTRIAANKARTYADERTRVAVAAAKAAAAQRSSAAAAIARQAEQTRVAAVAKAVEEERKAAVAKEDAQRAAAVVRAQQAQVQTLSTRAANGNTGDLKREKEEADRRAASARAAGFKETLETHRKELIAGVRTHSPYFPDFVANGTVASQPTASTRGPLMAAPITGNASTRPIAGLGNGPSHSASQPGTMPGAGLSGATPLPARHFVTGLAKVPTPSATQPAVENPVGPSRDSPFAANASLRLRSTTSTGPGNIPSLSASQPMSKSAGSSTTPNPPGAVPSSSTDQGNIVSQLASQPISGDTASPMTANPPRVVLTPSTEQAMLPPHTASQPAPRNSASPSLAGAELARAMFTASMDQGMAHLRAIGRLTPESLPMLRGMSQGSAGSSRPSSPLAIGADQDATSNAPALSSVPTSTVGQQASQLPTSTSAASLMPLERTVTPGSPASSSAPPTVAGNTATLHPSAALPAGTPAGLPGAQASFAAFLASQKPTRKSATPNPPVSMPTPSAVAARTSTSQQPAVSPVPVSMSQPTVSPALSQRKSTTVTPMMNRVAPAAQPSSQPLSAASQLAAARPVSLSQPVPVRSSHLPIQRPPVAPPRSDKKPAVLGTPQTGAMSPYGHLLSDAPETSALLAELEALSQSVEGSSTDASGLEAFAGLGELYGAASAGPSTSFSLPSSMPIAGPSRYNMPSASTQSQRIDKGKGKVRSPVKAKSVKPIVPVDKRPGMFRKKAPISVLERADRVRSQRMFMVHQTRDLEHLHATMHILGSTGNVYTVEFGAQPTCTCPDFAKGSHCKHLIFVALKVLRMPEHGSLWYQKAYNQSELRGIFHSAPPNAFDTVTAPANVQQAFREQFGLAAAPATGTSAGAVGAGDAERDGDGKRKPVEGDECPICSDEMKDEGRGANELVYDLGAGGCGKPLHKQCYQMAAEGVTRPIACRQ